MAKLLRKEMVGSKIDILVKHRDNILEQRNYLQTLLDGADEVLQLATSWLSNYDGANDVTFKNINKMIDDKLMFLSDTDISVDCEKTFMPEENTATRSLPTGSSSTDQPLIEDSSSTDQPLLEDSSSTDQPLPPDEQNAIVNQVKVKQDAMAILSKSTENLSVKQYKMVCQIVDDRLAPLEKLRNVFNENLDKRDKNLEKLDNVCDQMASILPKIAQLETERPGPTVGFSACLPSSIFADMKSAALVLRDFVYCMTNNENNFNTTTGVFTAPLDGLYVACLSLECQDKLNCYFIIKKQPCLLQSHSNKCNQCSIAEISKSEDTNSACVFRSVKMKAGEKLSVICGNDVAEISCYLKVMFACFKID